MITSYIPSLWMSFEKRCFSNTTKQQNIPNGCGYSFDVYDDGSWFTFLSIRAGNESVYSFYILRRHTTKRTCYISKKCDNYFEWIWSSSDIPTKQAVLHFYLELKICIKSTIQNSTSTINKFFETGIYIQSHSWPQGTNTTILHPPTYIILWV